jgi:hypothetical protein
MLRRSKSAVVNCRQCERERSNLVPLLPEPGGIAASLRSSQ